MTAPPAPRRSHRLRRLALGLASSLLALLLAATILELYVRWRLPKPDAPAMYRFDLELGKRLEPGFRGDAMGTTVEINADGMRDRETTPTRRPGSRRILALGDSWTFGSGVGQHETWPEQLERLLGGPDCVEVLNTGVAGYETFNEARYYARDLQRFEHDLVVVGFYPVNDVHDKDSRYELYRRLHAVHPALLDLYRWPRTLALSQLYSEWRTKRKLLRRQAFYADRAKSQGGGSPGQPEFARPSDDWSALYTEEYRGWRVCREALAQLGADTGARGATLAVVLFPDLRDLARYARRDNPRIAPLVRAATEEAGGTFIDLVGDFLPWAGREPEIGGAWGATHPNPAGYALIARAVARELNARGLLAAKPPHESRE
jgi:lysophospholipase L1-like esterase